jgi:hypothetical protein
MLIPNSLSINPDILSIAYSNSGSNSGIVSATVILALDGRELLQGTNLIDCLDRSVLPDFSTSISTTLFDTQNP